MSSELADLYQELILDHAKRPRNFGTLESAELSAEGNNPVCGDKFTVFIQLDNDVVKEISFAGTGCAISTASASLMTQAVKGQTIEFAISLFDAFHALLTSDSNTEQAAAGMGKLVVFAGVRQFPARVKCATLAWHTLRAALANQKESVTTE